METKDVESASGAENVSDREAVAPYVDVFENEQEILVVADLPGVAKEDLTIGLDDGELTIVGRRRPASHGTALGSEYRQSDFRRSFVLPQGIDQNRIDAHLAAGVLRLRLPKAESLRPRRIAVRSG